MNNLVYLFLITMVAISIVVELVFGVNWLIALGVLVIGVCIGVLLVESDLNL